MATSEGGMTSEQEMTDTAEEGETPASMTETRLQQHVSEDSNSTAHETEETESAVSTDREMLSNTPQTPTTSSVLSSPQTPGASSARKELSPNKGLPFRSGITWKKGERVEAMDYLNMWYPAKLIEIDEEEKTVLIHFEGWNQRYDEWVPMDSEGIRPLTRHSERKERSKKQTREYRPGEKVYAKWTDCKMYPAKVSSVNSNGSIEVVFYDGFQKTVQPINVKPFSDKPEKAKVPSLSALKEARNQRKLEEGYAPTFERARSSSQESKDKGKQDKPRSDRQRKHKLIVAGSFLAKRARSNSAPVFLGRSKQEKVQAKKRFGMRVTSPVQARKDPSTRTSPLPVSTKRQQTPRVSPVQAKKESAGEEPVERRGKKRALSLPTADHTSPGQGRLRTEDVQTPLSAPAVHGKRVRSTEKGGGLAPKEFVIEPDHNLFKCTHPGCGKSFRKENLLDYHVKYYHTMEGRALQTPASRTKRRKTSSICSTDSDVSVSSKGKTTPIEGSALKRKRHISSASIVPKEEVVEEMKKEEVVEAAEEKVPLMPPAAPATPVMLLPAEGTKPASADVSLAEEAPVQETEDELAGDEVVNCLCGYNEENGLMIQCDVCLCWQHASCFNIKNEALPSKYVCFVCENPPGVRDSRRYAHNQDWFKTGQLPSFSFLSVKQSRQNTDTAKGCNSLLADVLNVKSVLHSLKLEIKTSGKEDHAEMKTWTRVCEEKHRRARALARRTAASASSEQNLPSTSEIKEETKPVVKVDLESPDGKSTEMKTDNQSKDGSPAVKEDVEDFRLKEESPLSKSMGCQASLDISGSSLDRSDDKLYDTSIADIDSDTSTMTASESSVSYMSAFPGSSGLTGSADDSSALLGRSEDKEVKKETLDNESIDLEEPIEDISFDEVDRTLLQHIINVQTELNERLDFIEEQVVALEKADAAQRPPQSASQNSSSKSVLGDVPSLKKSLHSLVTDMDKVKSMAAYH